jgi:hypothetical protein
MAICRVQRTAGVSPIETTCVCPWPYDGLDRRQRLSVGAVEIVCSEISLCYTIVVSGYLRSESMPYREPAN